MNKISILIILLITLSVMVPAVAGSIEHGASVDALNETVEIEISESGSKNYYGIDNIVGAKNKVITDENKDYYEIRNYELDDGTTVELIYPNGKENNADSKKAVVNGTETAQPRVYGKDGVTHIVINYDKYLHSEETVNYINDIGGRTTTVSNNLGRGDSWSQDGAAFGNQISGLETVEKEDGTYNFSHWEDARGNIVTDFFIEWENGVKRVYDFFAIYDFTPAPEPEPPENQTSNETDTLPTNDTMINGGENPIPITNESSDLIGGGIVVGDESGIDKVVPVSNERDDNNGSAGVIKELPEGGNPLILLFAALIIICSGLLFYRR